MTRATLAMTLLCVVACGPQRRLGKCSPSATSAIAPPVVVSLLGESVEVQLQLPPAVFCPEGNPVATDVVTEVLDAQNQPVAHTHSEASSSDAAGYGTRIRFTPTAAGVHYLTARFEPALGLAQRQAQVARERSAEPPWLRLPLGQVCDEVLPMRELILCRRGSQVSLVADGGALSTEPVVGMATAGSIGWLWTATRLSRLEELDGGLVRLELPVATGGAVSITEERWVQGLGLEFTEVRVEDGGLAERRWTIDAAAGPVAGPGMARAGEVLGWSTASKLCAGTPDAGPACIDSPPPSPTSGWSGLWLRGAESGVVALARVASGGGPPVVLFVPAQTTSLMDARLPRPAFNWSTRLVAVRADDLSFEAWTSPGLVARQTVNEASVVFQLQSGETVIYRR